MLGAEDQEEGSPSDFLKDCQSVSAMPGLSVTNSEIRNCNKFHCASKSLAPTKRIWKIGLELEVSLGGSVGKIVGKIKDLENRDKKGSSLGRAKEISK